MATVKTTLKNWRTLNQTLPTLKDERQLRRLLEAESAGEARQQFLYRIHSRLNKVRADAERAGLKSLITARQARPTP